MKLFLKNFLLFIAPFILISYPIDLLISNKLKKNKQHPGEIEVWNDIFNGNIDADIAIYGSSRAFVQINTKIIEDSLFTKAYNFGMNAQNFWLEYLRHKEYFKFNKKPKIIILSIDLQMLSKNRQLVEYYQFLPYMLWNKDIYYYTSSYVGFSKRDYFIPLLRYMGKTNLIRKRLFDHTTTRYRYKGYKGMNRIWNNDLENAKKSNENFIFKQNDNSIKLFIKFIKNMKAQDINLIFVYTPEYIEGQEFVKNRKEIISFYYEISYKYNIPFFNYSDSLISYNKNLFYNSMHLNKKGSDIFTNKFVTDLKNDSITSYYLSLLN